MGCLVAQYCHLLLSVLTLEAERWEDSWAIGGQHWGHVICIDQLEAGTAEDCTVVVKAEQQTVAGSQLSSGREWETWKYQTQKYPENMLQQGTQCDTISGIRLTVLVILLLQIVEIALFLTMFEMPYLDYCEILCCDCDKMLRDSSIWPGHSITVHSHPQGYICTLVLCSQVNLKCAFQDKFLWDREYEYYYSPKIELSTMFTTLFTPAAPLKIQDSSHPHFC